MRIISESVLMLLTKNYQNQSTLVETTACQSWRVFETHGVVTGSRRRTLLGQETLKQNISHVNYTDNTIYKNLMNFSHIYVNTTKFKIKHIGRCQYVSVQHEDL